ncbi:MAG: hypothetical protein LBV74_18880 [Tannerella sp.]|jgi:hypothetical protein|nr:hypothetical protein [Tannerella sp.]
MKRRTFIKNTILGSTILPRLAWSLNSINTVQTETGLLQYEPDLRDRLWMWGHEGSTISGLHNVPAGSKIGQAAAIDYMGIPNIHVVRYLGKPEYPFDEFIKQFSNTKRVSWSILEAGPPEETFEIKKQWAFELVDKMPNLVSLCLDDFFQDKLIRPISQLRELRNEMDHLPRKLSLPLVLYSFELELDIKKHIDYVDEVLFWTWHATDLVKLEENFNTYRNIVPDKPTWLGIYMWDFGNSKPIPVELMKLQLDFALEKFRQHEIEGMIFHCTPLVDLGLDAVEYSRKWIAEHAGVTR